jgi:solute carrier family 10 (sodium/bile acid cotransporter), member 7
MWASLTRHWFLTALAICYLGGYLGAELLQPLHSMTLLRSGVVFVVMWAMGVTLKADTVRRSMTRPLPSLLGIGVNVAVVPILCLPAMWLLPERLFGGLYITAIVPCTLASASVWTRKAGGDDSVAMMTTVVTNLACVVVVPLGIWLVLAQQAEIDAVGQVKKLSLLVVLPLILAQLMRLGGLARWADRNKPRLSMLGQCGILAMVIFGAIASADVVDQPGRAAESTTGWVTSLALVLAAASVHTLTLYVGIVLARLLKMTRASQIAIGIAGSQKTLMVGLQIAIDCGVSGVPMLVYHISQLVIDTVVAEHWKVRSNRLEQKSDSGADR